MADKANTPKKRLVKNPETFRERVVKASESNAKPSRRSNLKTTTANIVRPVAKPTASFLSKVFKRQPFKFIGKILGLIGKVLLPVYIRNSWKELKLVHWPSWKESRRLTTAVIIFALIFGILIAVVDYGLDKLFRNVLLK